MTKSRWAATVILIGTTVPLVADDSVTSFLEAADMTFTLEEADEVTVYDVTTADGYTFTLSAAEDGYTFGLDEAVAHTPQSGNWSRVFEPTHIDCGETDPRNDAAVRSAVASVEPILNNFLGSTDGGATAPYEFSAPFGADQLLGPIFEVLEMAGMPSSVNYATDGGHMHSAQGKLMSDQDRHTKNFKMQFFAGRCLIMGDWYGAFANNPDCRPGVS